MSADPNTFLIKNVRISHPNVWKATVSEKFPGGQPRWQATFILDKTEHAKDIAAIKSAIKNLVTGNADWKGKTVTCKGIKFQDGGPRAPLVDLAGVCLRDGAEKADKVGFGPDVMFISAARPEKTKKGSPMQPPLVVDQNGQAIAEDSFKIYGGCYVHARIQVYAQTGSRNGINADLIGVMFSKDGEPFGKGQTSVAQAFGDVMEPESYDSPVAAGKAAAGDDWG